MTLTPKVTRWLAAAALLLVFVALAWGLGRVLTLGDGERIVLRAGLVFLGLVGAVVIVWALRPREEPADAVPTGDDALVAVDAARRRLPRGALAERPLVLVLGTAGSCKTTVVTRADLDPELLAGDGAAAGDDGAPAPTRGANLWLARGAVLAEVGAPVLDDAPRWQRFVRAVRAPALRAAVGGAEPGPRSAVVCVSCDLFYQGAGAPLEAAAQLLRQRLAEAAGTLGLRLPVYVLFTKADRVPHFEDWSASLTRDEVRGPLGAALPLEGPGGAGSHAERLAARVAAAFAALEGSLAARRVDLLGRESVVERRLAAYEFPRELRKLAPAAGRLLTELCRPTQLGVAPELRGFYFVGARPVTVGDVAPVAAAPATASAPAAARADATSIFAGASVVGHGVRAAPPAYAPPTTRRVPQWVFLDRFVPDVVLADAGGVAAARGGVRVARTRRVLLGAGVAAGVVAAVGATGSWIGNRGLAERVERRAQAVAALPAVVAPRGAVAFASPAGLRALDDLRAVLDTLDGYVTDGVPARLRWGLWRGDVTLAEGRRVWLSGYRAQLHTDARSALVDSLRALPDAPRPGDDYDRVYSQLRTYLVLTERPDSSTIERVAPVLLDSWRRGERADADVAGLARRQFEHFAVLLAGGKPWRDDPDVALVRHTREHLGRFVGAERIYSSMVAEVGRAVPPARLLALAPQAAGTVQAPVEVPGAFTRSGWNAMQVAFGQSDRFFRGEVWVLGGKRCRAGGGARQRARRTAGTLPDGVRAALARLRPWAGRRTAELPARRGGRSWACWAGEVRLCWPRWHSRLATRTSIRR
jgi:type VI secretion system protein ImpL